VTHGPAFPFALNPPTVGGGATVLPLVGTQACIAGAPRQMPSKRWSLRRTSLLIGVDGAWSGLTPDGAPLLVRNLSTSGIYRLDLELP
jgi:hypothetical protein